MKVLLIDDDPELTEVLRYTFQHGGYSVATASDGEMGLRMFLNDTPDLIVLDMIMPRMGGMQVLQEVRRCGQVPVIVLTALSDEEHVVKALEIGADDYMVKPFRPRELAARATALLRRSGNPSVKSLPVGVISAGDVTLDASARQVRVEGAFVQLTPTEFSLLQYLMINHDIVVSVPDIIVNVWGYDADENDEVVKVTISRLRRKLEAVSSRMRQVVNVPGMGYMFQSGGATG